MNAKLRSTLALLLCSLLWGTAFIGQKVGMDSIGPLYFVAIRMTVAGLVILPFYALLQKLRKPVVHTSEAAELYLQNQKEILRQGIRGGLCLGTIVFVAMTTQQIGLFYTTSGKTAFITAFYIVLVPIIGLFLGHKTSLQVWIGAVLALVGLFFLCATPDLAFATSDLIILVGAVFWAVQILVTAYFAPKTHVVFLVGMQSLVCGLWAFVVAIPFETITLEGLQEALPSLLYTAVLCTGISYSLQAYGQKFAHPTVATIVMSMESVFAAVFGFLLLQEALSTREFLGCVIMLGAVILTQLPDKKKR